MKRLSSIFLKGLAAVLPVTLTLYLLYWIGTSAEALLGGLLIRLLPEGAYQPGMGLITGVLLILLVGLLLQAYLVRKLWALGERLVSRIPLVKTVYGAIQDLLSFFSQSEARQMEQVVSVPVGDQGYRLLGFVTREDSATLPPGLAGEDTVAVYLPMSYQIGGYTLFLPRSLLQPVDMSVDEAMRFAVTAGLSGGRESAADRPNRATST